MQIHTDKNDCFCNWSKTHAVETIRLWKPGSVGQLLWDRQDPKNMFQDVGSLLVPKKPLLRGSTRLPSLCFNLRLPGLRAGRPESPLFINHLLRPVLHNHNKQLNYPFYISLCRTWLLSLGTELSCHLNDFLPRPTEAGYIILLVFNPDHTLIQVLSCVWRYVKDWSLAGRSDGIVKNS